MTLLEVITSICRFVFMKREASLKVFERALQNNISKKPARYCLIFNQFIRVGKWNSKKVSFFWTSIS